MRHLILLAAAVALPAAANGSFFTSFESDLGGFSATGDWERGIPTGVNGSALGGFGGPEPSAAFDGEFVVGTVIGGLHSPALTSSLSQTFDINGLDYPQLTYYEWLDSGGNTFDTAEVFVDGSLALLADGGPTGAWREVVIPLAALDAGGDGLVTVEFVFSASTVVERVGWYLDSVSVAAIPEPASLSLLGMAGLGLVRRRSA
ncbi:MAG: PEP-CTERM sorting domain-containing protein [Phycisphaerae bacterium]